MYTKFKVSSVIVLSVLSTLHLAAAQATSSGLNFISDDATLQQQYEERYFSQSGISGDQNKPLETAGADVSLALATSMIIPENWTLKTSGDFQAATVSWEGGLTWPLILRNISQSEKIYITLDWIQKIATIDVPEGTNKTKFVSNSTDAQKSVEEDRNQWEIKKKNDWVKSEKSDQKINTAENQIKTLIEKQKEAQIANQRFIAELNDSKEKFERDNNELQFALEKEKSKKNSLIEKYSVINPSNSSKRVDDATELFKKHQDKWVLPFDPSFDYYLKGGHSDIITGLTPATFIAKAGTVEEVVTEWANEVNWHVEYRAKVRHYNPYQVEFKGTFIEASTDFILIFAQSNRPLNITFHSDVVIGTKKGLVTITDLNYTK